MKERGKGGELRGLEREGREEQDEGGGKGRTGWRSRRKKQFAGWLEGLCNNSVTHAEERLVHFSSVSFFDFTRPDIFLFFLFLLHSNGCLSPSLRTKGPLEPYNASRLLRLLNCLFLFLPSFARTSCLNIQCCEQGPSLIDIYLLMSTFSRDVSLQTVPTQSLNGQRLRMQYPPLVGIQRECGAPLVFSGLELYCM